MGGANSGRGKVPVDMEVALDLLERGEKIPAVAVELGVSPPTLRSRVAALQKKQGLLLQYRSIQSLQLTELQARVLEAITPEKIDNAPLRDLVMSYKILKDKEQVIEGKPSEIRGLVAHLIHLEKQEEAREGEIVGDNSPAGEEADLVLIPKNDLLSQLSVLDDSSF